MDCSTLDDCMSPLVISGVSGVFYIMIFFF